MKILMVSPYIDLALGGVSQVVPSLVRHVANHEVQIDWISTSIHPTEGWERLTHFSRQRHFSRVSRHDLIWSASLVKWFKEQVDEYDLVHFHTLFSPMITRLAMIAFQKSVPYWMTPHGMLDAWAIQHRGWKKIIYATLFEKSVLRRARRIHLLYEREAEDLKKIGVSTSTVEIPNGIELEPPLSIEKRNEFWQQFPEVSGQRKVLFFGRIHPKKGIHLLLEAFVILLEKHPQTHLIIAGPDEGLTRQGLEQQAKSLGIQDRICWTGLLTGDAKKAVLHDVDCFVLPSYSEGFSQAILESMSFGVPTLFTKECHFERAVREGGAWQIERSASLIAERLREVLDNLEEAKIKAEIGRQFIFKFYNWNTIGAKARAVYLQDYTSRE